MFDPTASNPEIMWLTFRLRLPLVRGQQSCFFIILPSSTSAAAWGHLCDFKDKVKYIPVWLVDFLFSGWQEHDVSSLYFVHSCSFLLGKQLTSGTELPLLDSDLCSSWRVWSFLPVPSSPQKLSVSEAFPGPHSSHLCLGLFPSRLHWESCQQSGNFLVLCHLRCLSTQKKKKGWVWWPS